MVVVDGMDMDSVRAMVDARESRPIHFLQALRRVFSIFSLEL